MIIRARVIVTMDGPPIEHGGLRINGDRIAEVGKSSEIASANNPAIELDDCVLLPGLIDAHCHLDYTCLRGKIAPQKSFTDWIRAINTEKAKLSEEDYLGSIVDGFREARRFGTTSIINLAAFPELIARCPAPQARTWWCPELIDVTAPATNEQIVARAIANNGGNFGLAPHALFTASPELYKRSQQIAAAENFLLTTHLAESSEEMQMFRDAAGPLFEFLRALGRDGSDCGRVTPLERFLQVIGDSSTPLRSAQNDSKETIALWIIAHLNELTERDFDLLKQLPEKFSIAHCPRSHAYFGHAPFAFEKLSELGFNICLATDSLASNADLSLFAEMRAFQKTYSDLSADELLKMVTANPATALGRAAELGKIAPDYLADMIALPATGAGDIYEQIIAFGADVPWMMMGGQIL